MRRLRPRPLLIETLRGLAGVGTWQSNWLAMLLVIAGVLAVWWPKQELPRVLASGDGPDTLAAVLVALALSMAYHAARCGAEEVQFVEQQSLREWVVATALPVNQVVVEHVLAQVVQAFYMVALAMPFAMCAMSIAGAPWQILGVALAVIVVHTLAWELLAALGYLLAGHRAVEMFITLRMGLAVALLAAGLLAPQFSVVVVVLDLLDGERGLVGAAGPFLAAWTAVIAAAMVGMRVSLTRLREQG